jgi:hypothetical protein
VRNIKEERLPHPLPRPLGLARGTEVARPTGKRQAALPLGLENRNGPSQSEGGRIPRPERNESGFSYSNTKTYSWIPRRDRKERDTLNRPIDLAISRGRWRGHSLLAWVGIS